MKVGEVYICFMLSLLSMPTDLRYVTSGFLRNHSLIFSYVFHEGLVSAKNLLSHNLTYYRQKASSGHQKGRF